MAAEHEGRDEGPDEGKYDERPETAMASGNDDGTPGWHLAAEPLSAEEQAVLAGLTAPAPHVVDPLEDTVAASYAVEDDAPVPSARQPGGEGATDPDTPQFREP